MISASIFVSVLALVAAASAVGVLITLSRRTRVLELQRVTTANALSLYARKLEALQRIGSELKSTAPVTLAAEVADLREAVRKLADTQRRFQGRFDQRMGRERDEAAPAPNGVDDDELTALLSLQTAGPPAGQ